ncbi:hypothetical protein [Bacillus sp. SG-1]|uniref:hypothetical protein n=1 Tax=Bacillus sp. SG-1 TaxID=161544 RepID=UPI0001543F3E|nr:hypothetical protein [Bacillus sp. SG-1]EDL66421.1 hypothetical protein BSG1_03675 [Bacillus sp. SG-1]
MNEDKFDSKMKELFNDDSIPSIVKNRINDTYDMIESESKRRRKFFPFSISKGLRAALIGGGLVALSTVGVIASQGFQLFDSEGDVVMELTEPPYDIRAWDAENAEAYKEKVEPGEALVSYRVSDYPEKIFTVYRQPRLFSDHQEYKNSINHGYAPSETLPFGLTFTEGKITVDAEESQFKPAESELYAKARYSEEEVLSKIVKVKEKKDQIVAVTHYKNEKFDVFIRSSSKVELYEKMPLDDGELVISKTKINHHDEAFHLKQETGAFPYQSILWIKEYDGEKLMYEVLTYALDKVTKEQLIEIAESVNG